MTAPMSLPMRIDVPIKRLRPEATLPVYSHGPDEDAGLDLSYCGEETLVVPPLGRILCPTGLAIQLPPGCEGQVRPRSGLAAKRGITILNAPGTIDPGYRGEIKVILVNLSDAPQQIAPGDRIAQLVIAQYCAVELKEVETLDGTRREAGGFGSTG